MNEFQAPDTGELLNRARTGDRSAVDTLLARHRRRIRRMIAARLDDRLDEYAKRYPECVERLRELLPTLDMLDHFSECDPESEPVNEFGTDIDFAETQRHLQTHEPTHVSAKSPSPFHKIADLGIQAAEALEYAHQSGVVHRDIKPSNLMIDASGHLWITDFGLAMTRADANLTMTGDLLGTLRYMSPEQIRGKRQALDHRTDIYSLGATLYELLTLRPPATRQSRADLMQAILEEEPRPPREIHAAIPADLETIVLKAISKEPAARYSTAQELADDLRRFLEGRPIAARPPSLSDRARSWARRHRPLVRAGTVLIAAAVLTLTVSAALVYRQHAEVERQREVLSAFQEAAGHVLRGAQLAKAAQYPAAIQADRQAIALLAECREELVERPEFWEELASAQWDLRKWLLAAKRESEATAIEAEFVETCLAIEAHFPDRPDYREKLTTVWFEQAERHAATHQTRKTITGRFGRRPYSS